MKLYCKHGACSLAVRILIHEIGIPCTFEEVDLRTKKMKSGGDYFAVNPKGAVPALELDDGNLLTENAVIQQYLADTHNAVQLLPSVGKLERYRVLEWLNFVSTDLHKNCSPLFNPKIPDSIKEEVLRPNLKRSLNFANQRLEKQAYLAGENFTLPDGYLFVVLTWLPSLGLSLSEWPALQRHFEKLKQRKAIQQSLEEEGLLSSMEGSACGIK